MFFFLFTIAVGEALAIGWLYRAVQRGVAAHLAAHHIFEGWNGMVQAQAKTNLATLHAVQAIQRALGGHRDSLVLLHAQDQQILEILAACKLIDVVSSKPITVN